MQVQVKNLDKFSLCVLMTQFGKTFVAIDKILQRLEEDHTCLHVVYTMNTLLNNAQFANRLSSVEEAHGKGSVVVFSSKYNGSFTHATSKTMLEQLVSHHRPKVVVMCSNHKRFKDGFEWVCGVKNAFPDMAVHMIYDELHYYIKKSIRKQIEYLHELPHIHSILALTATPKSIIQKRGMWSRLKLVVHEHVSLENYVRLEDMKVHNVDDFFMTPYIKPHFLNFEMMDDETIGFMEHVIDANPDILAPGTRVFLPGHVRRQGHISVRDLVLDRCPSAVIVIINAKDKSLVYTENDAIVKVSIASNEVEVSERIGQILEERNLMDRTVVVTGFMCVGMGQTLAHKSFGNFTHAIISHMNISNASVYQLFGRLTGRMKHWDVYQQTKLFCPTTISNRIKVMEECAFSMFTKEEITQPIYRQPIHEMPEGADVLENEPKLVRANGTIVSVDEEGEVEDMEDDEGEEAEEIFFEEED